MDTLKVTGIKELQQQIKQVKTLVRKGTQAAAYAGARVYRQKLRQAAPTRNKTARNAIVALRGRVPNEGTGIGNVGLKGPGFYLNILSVGSKAHEIRAGLTAKIVDPKTRKILGKRARKRLVLAVSKRPGGALFWNQFLGPQIKHPGLSGNNWLRSILDGAREEAVAAVGDRYNEAIGQALV